MSSGEASHDALIRTKVLYFGREKYYHQMQVAAVEGIKRSGGDPAYRFLYSMALVLEGRVQEGIRELDPLQSHQEVMLGTLLALVHAHKRCLTVDKEAVALYDARLKEERRRADDRALYYAGLFLLHVGRHDKAKEYVDRLLKINPQSVDGLNLKGWVVLATVAEGGQGSNKEAKDAAQYFEAVLQQPGQSRNLEAFLGKVKYHEMCGYLDKALDLVSTLVVAFGGGHFTVPLVEKLKIELSLQDWDRAEDTANRILEVEPKNLEATKIKILHRICRSSGGHEEAAVLLNRFFSELEKAEPKNAAQFIVNARLFSRVCGRDFRVLEATAAFAEKAASLDLSSALAMAELGHQCLLRNRVREAQRYYKTATKLDETSVVALIGVIACQLLEGQFEVAREQLEFLKEIQGAMGDDDGNLGAVVAGGSLSSVTAAAAASTRSEILYLNALLGRLSGRAAPEEVLALLNDAVDTHFRSVRGLNFGPEYLTALNPDYVTTLVKEYLLQAPNTPAPASASSSSMQGPAVSPALKKILMVLERVTKACPGLKDALFLMAKARYLSGDIKASTASLQHLIDNLDPTMVEAHLLMAQIQLHQGRHLQALQSLEVGLSFNFQVREHPLFHLINAKVQKDQGNLPEALKTLQTAMTLVKRQEGVKGAKVKVEAAAQQIPFTRTDKLSLYLELSDVCRMSGRVAESNNLMQEALVEFKGTPEEMRLAVSNADLALERGDVDEALNILQGIGPDQTYFLQAKEKMAHIYLKHLKDKKMFTQCYKQMVDMSPTPQSYVLLGDAYMSIQEPERALETYEQAVRRSPKDPQLAAKMGQALQRTHQFGKAINYYKEAVRNDDGSTGNSILMFDLAQLQMRLKQYEKAERTIMQALESTNVGTEGHHHQKGHDVQSSLMTQAKFLGLLAQIQEMSGNVNEAIRTLTEAKEIRTRLLKRMQLDQQQQPEALAEQRRLTAQVCHRMAEHALNKRDHEGAIRHYKEAIAFDPQDKEAMCALAKLYLTLDDLDQCQYACASILNGSKEQQRDDEEATVMMADLAFRKNDYEAATVHFQQLLEKRPDYFVALARLVEVMRRTGHLERVPAFLARSEEYVVARAPLEPGINFCRGLYEWYSGNPNGALKLFNKARRDPEWGQRSIYNMIEICLNPDNNVTLAGGEAALVDEAGGSGGGEDKARDGGDGQEMALKTAEKLLKELKPKLGQQMVSFRLLQGMLALATKRKADVERGLQEFVALAEQQDQGATKAAVAAAAGSAAGGGGDCNVGAVLGMATAYQLLKQTPRARNQLKRVAKHSWNFEDAEHLERCWLLLADIYIQGGKFDMATELLRKVLLHNKSSTKAYELMGFIMEKESSYKDAAQHYEQAWKFSNKASPAVGYKLAFNYMKAKRYTDAIDVCHDILAKYPGYPKVKKDILDKSRDNLKR